MEINKKRFNTYKELSIVIILVPMLFILIDTLGRINSRIYYKNIFEHLINMAFMEKEIIVKVVLLLVIAFVISKIKVIKEKFILGDFKVIIGYTILGIIAYKFFGTKYELYQSLDIYIMCLIGLFLIVSGINDMTSSVDNIDITLEEKCVFESEIYSRVKYLGIMYFIVYILLICIENINTIIASEFVMSMIDNYSSQYNNMARVMGVLGILVALLFIFAIRKSFYSLNLCYEEYIYIVKHKTFIEEIKKDVEFVNHKVESSNKYFNKKFKNLEDKKAQVLIKGMFDLFKNNKNNLK